MNFAARAEARLLLKFPLRGDQRCFPGPHQAFRNTPCAMILVFPERSSGMPKQNFDALAYSAEKEDASTFWP
jgi:hypothetical protein